MTRWVAGCVFALSIATNAHALDGDADPAFGDNGQVAITRPLVGGGNGTKPTGDLLQRDDGRYLWATPLDDGSVWVGRAFRDGTPDADFGGLGHGRVTLPACGASRNVRLADDGSGGAVVWAGSCLVRLDADGHVVAGFADGATMPPAGFSAAGLARDAQGRYVLAGDASATEIRVHRYAADGADDDTFGTLGSTVVVVPSTNGVADLNALAVRADGRIVVGGDRGNTHGPNMILVQLNEDGTPDPSWDSDGIVDLEPPPGYDRLYATALAIDGDGSLVVSGMSSDGGVSCCLMLARFDTAGQLVPAFGLRIFRLSTQPSLFPFFEQRDGLVLLPNGRIVMGAISFPFGAPFTHRTQYTLVRAFADGSLDASFGHDGWNSYTIADPVGVGQTGDYVQMHAIAYDRADDSMLLLGRTFFEDNSTGDDYVTFVRARFDLVFADAFDR
ncbi:hypothetical protein [Dokdonella sp.]|uniref:delta-60 repeat domain-containing protein n=1 Tax=Dokdonella sp. TaxID=2291710 RepID=UPI002F402A24